MQSPGAESQHVPQSQSRAVKGGVTLAAVVDSDSPFRRLRLTRRCALCSVLCDLCSVLCTVDASGTFAGTGLCETGRSQGAAAQSAFFGVTGAHGARNRLHVGRHRRHAVRH